MLADRKVLEAEIGKLTKSVAKTNGSIERDEIRDQLKEKLAALQSVEAKLRTPALSCEDVTGEKLAVLLAHNTEQIASLSADALAIVNILLGRYNKLDRTDEGIYLKGRIQILAAITGEGLLRAGWQPCTASSDPGMDQEDQ